MGRPSGVAERFEALAARKPAEEITVFSINCRLEIGVITLDFPAGAIFAGEEFVRFGEVGDFCAGGVKEKPLAAESKGDGSKVHRVGDRAGQLEIAVAGGATFEGGHPGGIAVLTGAGSALGWGWVGQVVLRQ